MVGTYASDVGFGVFVDAVGEFGVFGCADGWVSLVVAELLFGTVAVELKM